MHLDLRNNAKIDWVKILFNNIQFFQRSINCLIGYLWPQLFKIKFCVFMVELDQSCKE